MFQSNSFSISSPHFSRGITILTCGVLLFLGGCLIAADDEVAQIAPSNRIKPTHAAILAKIQKEAQAGDGKAQWILGMLHLNGEEVPLDFKESAKWMRKAADQNHKHAQFMLGLMHVMQHGLPKDDRAAVEWFRRAKVNGFDLDAVRKEYCEKHESLRMTEANAWMAHIAKYQELHRGGSPESETYQDLDGSFRFYEGSVSSRHERDTEALKNRLQASRPARERDMDSYEKLVQLIDEAISASSDQK